MARRCDLCGKGPQVGYNVSHSHVRTKRRWLPNLQAVKVLRGQTPVTVRVCAKCLKKGKVTRRTASHASMAAASGGPAITPAA